MDQKSTYTYRYPKSTGVTRFNDVAHQRLDKRDNANKCLIREEAESQNEREIAKTPRGSLVWWKPKGRVQITLRMVMAILIAVSIAK